MLPRTIPSFVEWFHRLVAMVTGWFIVGTAVWSWRRPNRRTRLTATLATLLLPLQISIGAVTVTLNGMLPAGYSPPTQGAHLVVALTIFSLLVSTTLSARDDGGRDPPLGRIRRALLVALVALIGGIVTSRVFTPIPYSPSAQAAFYGSTLVVVAALIAATRWLAASTVPHLRIVTGAGLGFLFAAMLLGRDLVFYTPTVRLVNAAAFLLAAGAILAATALARRARAGGRTGPVVG